MATVRFSRGHWVADYYDTKKRRRIEQPKGHFKNLTDEMIGNGEDIVRVSRLMGHANAPFTFNVYCHMLPRKRDPIGDRLACLVFGNKMETDRDAESQQSSEEKLLEVQ